MRTHIIEGKPKKTVTIEVDGHSLTLTEGIDITVIVVVAAQQSAQADLAGECHCRHDWPAAEIGRDCPNCWQMITSR